MNKSILFHILTIGVCSFVLYSCEDIIDIHLRSVDPKIVIEGGVYLDSLPTIRITTTKDFDDTNEYPPVKDAVVEIWDNAGNRETLLFDTDLEGYVATNPRLKGVERQVYNLSVKYREKEYQALSVMPPLVRLDSLTLSRIPLLDYPCPTIHFTTSTQRESGGYRCVTRINDRLRTNEIFISSDRIENKSIHLIIPVFRRDEEKEDPIKRGDEITVELQCLDEELYNFFQTLESVDNNTANPVTNIKGGALGYFGAFASERKMIKVEW
ncbi:hypothetical protein EZS27_018364 [termite gut metagenome]|uniref:DUF4249 domain-containing protein n=1 Tax=termite gut metagenome TaxID=433724 RepID=A0A5J4RGN3_9ZZZZ